MLYTATSGVANKPCRKGMPAGCCHTSQYSRLCMLRLKLGREKMGLAAQLLCPFGVADCSRQVISLWPFSHQAYSPFPFAVAWPFAFSGWAAMVDAPACCRHTAKRSASHLPYSLQPPLPAHFVWIRNPNLLTCILACSVTSLHMDDSSATWLFIQIHGPPVLQACHIAFHRIHAIQLAS